MIDVARPDPPLRLLTGEHRLQNLPDLVAVANLLMHAAGAPLDREQQDVLVYALDSLLFGEQAE